MKCSILLMFLFFSLNTQAFDGTYELVVNKKQEKKKNTRWTLAEWLQQKERVRAMDMWLAMNSSSNLFEFYMAGSKGTLDIKSSNISEDFTQAEAGAFATITGVEYQYTDSDSFYQSRYMFTLRLFGTSQQSTNLSVSYGGLAHNQNTSVYKTDFYKGSLSLYLTQFFGVQAENTWINKTVDSNQNTFSGSELNAIVFIDFKALRIFGKYQTSEYLYNANKVERSGILTGIKLYF